MSYYILIDVTCGVHSLAEKKTQPVKPGGYWGHEMWENMLYISLDIVRKHFTKKWTGRRKDWGQIHSQLEIFFADRLD